MWKRIVAYIVGIPLVFCGLLYVYVWYDTRPMRIEARKTLAEMAAREDALDSLGDLALDPAHATLGDLERSLHQPGRSLDAGHNPTSVGWACVANDCEVSASFLQAPGTRLDASAPAVLISIRYEVLRKPLHQVSIGGVFLKEPVSEMLKYCKSRGYGTPVKHHHMTWDKDWSFIWTEVGGKVSSLIFLNDRLIKTARQDEAGQAPEARR